MPIIGDSTPRGDGQGDSFRKISILSGHLSSNALGLSKRSELETLGCNTLRAISAVAAVDATSFLETAWKALAAAAAQVEVELIDDMLLLVRITE